jgi:hypothetical protein
MQAWLIAFDIILLVVMSLQDWKTHTIKMYQSFLFLVMSLVASNPQYLIETFAFAIILWLICREVMIAQGDRKILIGLTLQLGIYYGFAILALTVLLTFTLVRVLRRPIPMIPFIFISFIFFLIFPLIDFQVYQFSFSLTQ